MNAFVTDRPDPSAENLEELTDPQGKSSSNFTQDMTLNNSLDDSLWRVLPSNSLLNCCVLFLKLHLERKKAKEEKRRKTSILTDTPEKDLLEAEKKNVEEKKLKNEQKKKVEYWENYWEYWENFAGLDSDDGEDISETESLKNPSFIPEIIIMETI
ncbi:hypothetical protein NQ318_023646 [Aromia moschata]|uniref:Uncharacterized protein n=1 Tax=Aromia moschata TaxID=1265417 RepID=A0AAV8YRT3_9CUCU|nr:hypothetical protein NQ318_023646 [Aromia moschata]